VMVVGGGRDGIKAPWNQNIARINRDGSITRLKLVPEGVRLRCVPSAKFMCDPASGEYVVQTAKGDGIGRESDWKSAVYAYHPILDEWKEITGLGLPPGVGAPIDTYGVMMICNKSKVYLYKHKPVWPKDGATTRPAAAK